MKQIIIALSAKKDGGKSTVANFLKRNRVELFGHKSHRSTNGTVLRGPTVATFPLAGPVKDLCANVLGLTHEQLYGTNEQKNSLTRYQWEDLPHYPRIVERLKSRIDQECFMEWYTSDEEKGLWEKRAVDRLEKTRPKGLMTARQVMQEVGTGIFRQMYADVWAEACVRGIRESKVDVALIDDLRFPNEVLAVQSAGGLVLRLPRDAHQGKDQHASEMALDRDVFDWAKFDAVIGDGTEPADRVNQLVVEALARLDILAEGKVPF